MYRFNGSALYWILEGTMKRTEEGTTRTMTLNPKKDPRGASSSADAVAVALTQPACSGFRGWCLQSGMLIVTSRFI